MRVILAGPELEENLALRYIHACVEQAGHEAWIFDFHAADQIPDLAATIAQVGPDVVGLSMVFTARSVEFIRLAQQLRAAGYDGHITAGGHFATFHASELLSDYAAIDSIIHGEGERALVELLESLDRPQSVDGLSYRDAAGDVQCTPTRQNPPDLNSLPWPTRPDRFHDYLGLPIANLLSGRGCFANCHFCSIAAWHRRNGGRRFRQRNVRDVADEMAGLYHNRGVRIFNFHDDNFFLPTRAANLQRLTEMKQRLADRGVGRIGFQVKARPDSVDPDVMSLLGDIGLFRVFLGVETNSVAGLVTLGRGVERRQNYRALKILKRLGVHTCFNLLMFDPETRPEDLWQNIDFMREQCEWPLNFCRTEIYAGTELERRMRAEDRLEGNYLGYSYRIRDPRVQLAYEMFRDVFTPRNFAVEGLNHQAMKLDYYLHILHHFWPQRADRSLFRRAKGLTGRLNCNSAHLLEKIFRLATGPHEPDVADVRRLVEECSVERARCDAQLAAEIKDVLRHIRELAGRPERSGKGRRVLAKAASVAAAVLIAVSSGCSRPDDSHMTEMAPAPTQPGEGPPSELPVESPPDDWHMSEMAPAPLPPGENTPSVPPTEIPPELAPVPLPKDWHMSEMAPRPMEPEERPTPQVPEEETHMCEDVPEPIDPAPKPLEPPVAEPADGDQTGVGFRPRATGLGSDDTRRVEQTIREHHRAALESVAARHLDNDGTVRVALQFDDAGHVARYGVEWPDHNPALEADLRDLLATWSFPFLRRGGLCTLAVALTASAASEPSGPAEPRPSPKDIPPIDTHLFEMVAPPIDPQPVRPPVKIERLPTRLVTRIEDEIYTKYRRTLFELSTDHLPKEQQSKPVSVELELDAAGKVVKSKIDLDKKKHVRYQQALGKLVSQWQFKFINQPGKCAVRVDPIGIFLSNPPKRPDIHMHERVPTPFRPKGD